eukprot:CAMPEP_0175647688 /NCGR_PEP_ID=MMETSP0097-20121207/7952_1 /TAXON_ID=311494 /ORGANISM="Alexandrium monilatum, Strain CCMP3105" /LENGTH=502 /DNA_ID=CAMNT_0016953597 /DNA_START=113 /DNA_END=1616 /DNA_ORIENTATION=-
MKFTPVYTETKCGDFSATMDGLTVSPSSINLGLLIEVSCVNPNPYSIEIVDTNPGRVFVGREQQFQIGRLTVLPGSKLQEEGEGKVRVHMSTHITGEQADALVPRFLEDTAVPVLMELQFSVGVAVSFGLGHWQTSAPFKKACGLNMAGLLVNQFIQEGDKSSSRLGPLVCRESFDFEIPPVGGRRQERRPDGQMKFSAAQVAPDEVTEGETVKNLSLGCVISFSFFSGFLLVYGAWRSAFGSPIAVAWPTSPLRQLSLPGDDHFRTLVEGCRSNDVEQGADVKLFGGGPGAGNLPRTPKIQNMRDISSPEEVAKIFSPVKYQRSKTCEGKLGLPGSPMKLSSLAAAAGDCSPSAKSPLKRSNSKSPRLLPPPPPMDPTSPKAESITSPCKAEASPPQDEAGDKRRAPDLARRLGALAQHRGVQPSFCPEDTQEWPQAHDSCSDVARPVQPLPIGGVPLALALTNPLFTALHAARPLALALRALTAGALRMSTPATPVEREG